MKKPIIVLALLFCSKLTWAGAWGPKAFENDDALDWLTVCVDGQSGAVSDALNAVLKSEFVGGDVGAAGIAAAEVVAAKRGQPSKDLPEDARACVATQRNLERLAASARKVVEKVMNPKKSELAAEWASNGSKSWQASLADLAKRLAR
jgi:hypothetical protein